MREAAGANLFSPSSRYLAYSQLWSVPRWHESAEDLRKQVRYQINPEIRAYLVAFKRLCFSILFTSSD